MLSPEFLLTSLVVVLVPGTGTVYTVSTGLFYGPRSSLAAAVGCTLGIVPHLLAGILGLAFVLHLSALVFQGLKYAGAAYLLYLAWSTWRDQGALSFGSASPERSAKQIVIRAILLNLLNPKLTLAVFALYGVLASSVRERVARSPEVVTWLRRSLAAAFAALGVRLAVTER